MQERILIHKTGVIKYINEPIAGRPNELLLILRDKNSQYKRLVQDIISYRDSLKNELDNETWLKVKKLLRMMIKINGAEKHYLYCQGMKDLITLSNYADNEVCELSLAIDEVEDDF